MQFPFLKRKVLVVHTLHNHVIILTIVKLVPTLVKLAIINVVLTCLVILLITIILMLISYSLVLDFALPTLVPICT